MSLLVMLFSYTTQTQGKWLPSLFGEVIKKTYYVWLAPKMEKDLQQEGNFLKNFFL
jgi:hypothetical protein